MLANEAQQQHFAAAAEDEQDQQYLQVSIADSKSLKWA